MLAGPGHWGLIDVLHSQEEVIAGRHGVVAVLERPLWPLCVGEIVDG